MGTLCSHGTGAEDKEEPAKEPPKYDPTASISASQGLTNHADVRLCKLGCGCQVQEGLYRGRPFDTCCRSCALSPGNGVHDAKCRGPPAGSSLVNLADAPRALRPVCAKGARCKQRVLEHLKAEAHPLDKDYQTCCKAAGVEPEEPSLKLLFDWADADGSGKLTKEELSATLHIINMLSGDDDPEDSQEISDEAWKKLDEDGNGLVNFNEFACWAGPRLGLPLGVKKMMFRSATQGALARPCGVFNCPCENYHEGTFGLHCAQCKHKSSSHVAREHTGEIPFPEYWDNHGESPHALVDMKGMVVSDFQKLVDRTYKNAWTRDRSRHNENKKVPSGFKVVAVHRNENSESWQEYAVRRASLLTRIQEGQDEPIEALTNVKTMLAWKDIMTDKADRLAPELNEWYLFHGTNPKAAQAICSSDFKLSFAGGNTGTLYGRGLYFAESFTKSDEYAKSNENGTYAMLMCRILGGRFKYTDLVNPDVEELVQSVTEGPFDTICGDREKCRGTYREFVIFDTEDVYPEYLIEYKRNYD